MAEGNITIGGETVHVEEALGLDTSGELVLIRSRLDALEDDYYSDVSGYRGSGYARSTQMSSNYKQGSNGWIIKENGDVEFNDGTFRGALIAGSIDIPDTTSANSFHVDSNGNMWLGATTFGAAPAKIANTGAATFSSITITGGTISGAELNDIANGSMLSIQGWQFNGTFSASDNNTVAWGSGTLRFPDGQTYSISASNTGNISTTTYIYFDLAASTTAFQTTTTASSAVGTNRVLIAVARNNSDSSKNATFQVFGGAGGVGTFITADEIAANTITANEIAANTITANEMNVSQLSAITADMGALTAGTITLSTSGAGFIRSGQTAYDTGTGFFLGKSGATTVFSIGVSSGNKLTWDGSTLFQQLTSNGGITIRMPSASLSKSNSGLIIEASDGTDVLKINDNAFITRFNNGSSGGAFAAASNTSGTFGSDWFQMYCETDSVGSVAAGVLEMPSTNRILIKRSGSGAVIRLQGSSGNGAIDLFEPLILNSLAADPGAAPSGFSYTGAIYFSTALGKIRVNVGGGVWQTVTSV